MAKIPRNEFLKLIPKRCQLEENKICDNCCECFICDLDSNKICDNCADCITNADYNGVVIDEILLLRKESGKINKACLIQVCTKKK